jgi:hypothetical protein
MAIAPINGTTIDSLGALLSADALAVCGRAVTGRELVAAGSVS